MSRLLTRRRVLAGLLAGAACNAARGDVRADGGPPAAAVKRLVLVVTPNGTQQANFWPGSELMSPILRPILAAPELARRTTVVRGVYYPRDRAGASGNEHDIGFTRMFTGAKILSIGRVPYGGAASIDHVLGERWNVDPFNVAVVASSVEPYPKLGFESRASFSYVAPGVMRQPYVDPFDAYAALFAGELASADDARRRIVRARALDASRQELEAMRARLGAVEQSKLDAHARAAGALARRLGAPAEATACVSRPSAPRHYGAEAPELLTKDESAIPEMTSTMIDLIVASFACGLRRIATLQLGHGGAKWRFAWEEVYRDAHLDLAHYDTRDEGARADVTTLLVRVHRWYATQVAALATKLDAIPEGNGTMLDNTLIVWTSEVGRGDHDLRNVPLVFLGGAGGALRGGQFLDRGEQTFQRVGCTILRAMGEDVAGFGDEDRCGPLEGVLAY